MFLKPDCIPCILSMSLNYLRKLSVPEEQVNMIYSDILSLKPLRGEMWDMTSPEVIEPIMKKIMAAVDDKDPFAAEKEKQNRKMLSLYPELQRMVKTAEHPLRTAAHLAGLGNAIDVMMEGGADDIQKIIKEQLAYSLQKNVFEILEKRIISSNRILYFGDNAGEIVLDRLFIETIKEQHDTDIIFVVRRFANLERCNPERCRTDRDGQPGACHRERYRRPYPRNDAGSMLKGGSGSFSRGGSDHIQRRWEFRHPG